MPSPPGRGAPVVIIPPPLESPEVAETPELTPLRKRTLERALTASAALVKCDKTTQRVVITIHRIFHAIRGRHDHGGGDNCSVADTVGSSAESESGSVDEGDCGAGDSDAVMILPQDLSG